MHDRTMRNERLKPAVRRQRDLPSLRVGARTLQPVVRVTGVRGGRGGGGAWLRAEPIMVRVREGDGREYDLPIVDGTRRALISFVASALFVAMVSWAVRLRQR